LRLAKKNEKKVLAQAVYAEQLHAEVVFFNVVMEQQGNVKYRIHMKFLKMFVERKLHLIHISLNG
jgi:hypothetical protein